MKWFVRIGIAATFVTVAMLFVIVGAGVIASSAPDGLTGTEAALQTLGWCLIFWPLSVGFTVGLIAAEDL